VPALFRSANLLEIAALACEWLKRQQAKIFSGNSYVAELRLSCLGGLISMVWKPPPLFSPLLPQWKSSTPFHLQKCTVMTMYVCLCTSVYQPTRSAEPCIHPESLSWVTAEFGWGKRENVTSARWHVWSNGITTACVYVLSGRPKAVSFVAFSIPEKRRKCMLQSGKYDKNIC